MFSLHAVFVLKDHLRGNKLCSLIFLVGPLQSRSTVTDISNQLNEEVGQLAIGCCSFKINSHKQGGRGATAAQFSRLQ